MDFSFKLEVKKSFTKIYTEQIVLHTQRYEYIYPWLDAYNLDESPFWDVQNTCLNGNNDAKGRQRGYRVRRVVV